MLADLGIRDSDSTPQVFVFEHEGELTISLFKSDQRLYSLTFTLGQIGAELAAYVGGLQGFRSPKAVERNRSFPDAQYARIATARPPPDGISFDVWLRRRCARSGDLGP